MCTRLRNGNTLSRGLFLDSVIALLNDKITQIEKLITLVRTQQMHALQCSNIQDKLLVSSSPVSGRQASERPLALSQMPKCTSSPFYIYARPCSQHTSNYICVRVCVWERPIWGISFDSIVAGLWCFGLETGLCKRKHFAH